MDEIETLPPNGQELRPDEAWVHLLPLGEARARDGRVFRITEPAAIIRASMLGADLPVDARRTSWTSGPPSGAARCRRRAGAASWRRARAASSAACAGPRRPAAWWRRGSIAT